MRWETGCRQWEGTWFGTGFAYRIMVMVDGVRDEYAFLLNHRRFSSHDLVYKSMLQAFLMDDSGYKAIGWDVCADALEELFGSV